MPILSLLSRPRRVFALVAIALSSLSFWTAFHDRSTARPLYKPHKAGASSLGAGCSRVILAPQAQLPPKEDISQGYWYPAPELRSTSTNSWLIWKCFGRDVEPLPGEERIRIDDGARVENVDGWQWLLQGGHPMRELDPEEFLARAFKSRIGYVIVGDSISLQMFEAMRYLAAMPHPHTPEYSIFGTYGKDQAHQYFTLAPTNILRERLMARADLAHVPRARFNEPFARFWRADVLLQTTEDLADIFTAMGTQLNMNDTTNRRFTPWLKEIAAYADYNGGVTWQGELPSPVMINVGPHFDPIRFLPVRREHVRQAYTETVGKVAEDLLRVQNVPLRVTFRATLPAHPQCEDVLYPVPWYHPAATSATTSGIVPYSWESFPEYNNVARRVFDGRQHGQIRMEWLDVWEMGLTRPDAHIGKYAALDNGTWPQYDCLHWCMASVPRWVVKAWWHVLSSGL